MNLADKVISKVIKPNGKTDLLAMLIYVEILKNSEKGEWQTGYGFLSEKFKCSKEQIRKKLVLLEGLDLIKRELRDIKEGCYIYKNALFLVVKNNEIVEEFNKNPDYF